MHVPESYVQAGGARAGGGDGGGGLGGGERAGAATAIRLLGLGVDEEGVCPMAVVVAI